MTEYNFLFGKMAIRRKCCKNRQRSGLKQKLTVVSLEGLVGFCSISTFLGYLMPNTVYTYILNTYG